LVDKQQMMLEKTSQAGLRLIDIKKQVEGVPSVFVKNTYKFVKIRDRKTEMNFNTLIGVMFVEISILAGIKDISDENKRDIVKMILTACDDLTIEEIYKAFELERYGEYGQKTEHFQLFNADYIAKIIAKYREWKLQVKTQHNISIALLKEKNEQKVSQEEQKLIMDNAIKRLYHEFLDSGEVSIPCSYIFDEMYYREMFVGMDLPTYKRIAEREVKQEITSKKSTSKFEYNEVKETLKNIESNDRNEKVLAYAKRLVIHDYFTRIKNENNDINDLI
jgi:hypothetical protein